MSRKAILIEASGIPGAKGYLPGAAADARIFEEYLRSAAGGAWESHEITPLHNPTLATVQRELAAAKSSDYCFVTASGHGRHVQGRGIDETRFSLTDGNEISAASLNTGSTRCAVVIDCCRHVTVLVEEILEAAMAQNMRKAAQYYDRALYRKVFDEALGLTEFGCSYLYSCNLNEAAQESEKGGYYSQALIEAAGRWFTSSSTIGKQVYDLYDVNNLASAIVTRREPQQHPQTQLGRRNRYFPFTVHV